MTTSGGKKHATPIQHAARITPVPDSTTDDSETVEITDMYVRGMNNIIYDTATEGLMADHVRDIDGILDGMRLSRGMRVSIFQMAKHGFVTPDVFLERFGPGYTRAVRDARTVQEWTERHLAYVRQIKRDAEDMKKKCARHAVRRAIECLIAADHVRTRRRPFAGAAPGGDGNAGKTLGSHDV